jgi:hypothetical protein
MAPRSVCRVTPAVPVVGASVAVGTGAGFAAGSAGVGVNAQAPRASAAGAWVGAASAGAAAGSVAAGSVAAGPEDSAVKAMTAPTTATTTATEVITAVRWRRLACASRRSCWLLSLRFAASRRVWLVATAGRIVAATVNTL